MTLLTETRPTLPGSWYYDAEHNQRELQAIWHRDWVCVGRADELPSEGDYLLRLNCSVAMSGSSTIFRIGRCAAEAIRRAPRVFL